MVFSCRFFGFLIAVSFCDFEFVKRDFYFLKTTAGRGWFDIFCSAMFLVDSDTTLTGWLMFGGLLFCGGFFVLLSMSCGQDAEMSDINSNELKAQGGKALLANQLS